MYTKIKIENEIKNSTDIIKETLAFTESCVKFWNGEGAKIYCDNLIGKLGNKETNEHARKTDYKSWLLDAILTDINTKVDKYPDALKVGRTSSHVFVHTLEGSEERVLMLHV
jgi:hypothetical protein